ncbi:retinol dehydrogenase 11 isoform X3 [Linepithema humile]|uniref:retinol dehydrogenase 11 isoform X3 n=1 Tax=Linepithema humile TaxID=83485 RepID=UPI00351F63FC
MWPFNTSCDSTARFDGKTVIITGANSGIGKETARDLYRRGARVILACRNMERANAAVDDIKRNPFLKADKQEDNTGDLAIYQLDLTSFASVKECAKNLLAKEPVIHILINNAGIAMFPFEKTVNGNEMHLQTNHLGHFLLTLLLLPRLQLSGFGCRIINVSSCTHWFGNINFDDINLEKSYGPWKAYTQSKLANILFTKELARQLAKAKITGINVYALHPGLIPTEIARHSGNTFFYGADKCWTFWTWLLFKNVVQGAQTTIYCAIDEKAGEETGLYYSTHQKYRKKHRKKRRRIAECGEK